MSEKNKKEYIWIILILIITVSYIYYKFGIIFGVDIVFIILYFSWLPLSLIISVIKILLFYRNEKYVSQIFIQVNVLFMIVINIYILYKFYFHFIVILYLVFIIYIICILALIFELQRDLKQLYKVIKKNK